MTKKDKEFRLCYVDENIMCAIAWLFSDSAGGLMAGASMDEAIAWCRKGKIKWGELTDGE